MFAEISPKIHKIMGYKFMTGCNILFYLKYFFKKPSKFKCCSICNYAPLCPVYKQCYSGHAVRLPAPSFYQPLFWNCRMKLDEKKRAHSPSDDAIVYFSIWMTFGVSRRKHELCHPLINGHQPLILCSSETSK